MTCSSDSDDKTVTNVSPSKNSRCPVKLFILAMAVLTVAFYGTFILNSGRRPSEKQVIVLCCHKEIVLWWYVKNWTGEHKVFIVMFNVRFYSVWIMPGSERVCQGSCTKVSLQLIPIYCFSHIHLCNCLLSVYVSQSQSYSICMLHSNIHTETNKPAISLNDHMFCMWVCKTW